MSITDWANAIASIESAGSGDYSAVGPVTKKGNRAYGRYQVMDFNIGPWTEQYYGRRLTPEEFLASPQAQDAVFSGAFGSSVEKYGNPQDAASIWFTGRPMSEGANRRDILGTTGSAYVNKFNNALGRFDPNDPAIIGADARRAIGKGLLANTTQSTEQGGTMEPETQPQQRQGLLGGLLGGFLGPEGRDARARLAIGIEGLMLNPNQALVGQLEKGIEGRETERQRNKTIEWLLSQGRTDLAAAIEGGLPAADALRAAMTPAPGPEIREVGGKLVSIGPNGTVSELYAPEVQPEFRRATPEEAAAYGATSGQFGPDGRFYPVDVPQGMTIESDGQGGFRMVQGVGAAAAKPFTEGQSKDVVFVTRAKGALQVLEPVADTLTSLPSQISSLDPTGFIRRRVQSPEFQVAQNAGNEFLQAILRKDTGAAITSDEQALYGETYLPRPGDGPEVLAAKQAARQRAVAAIEAGMSPAQMIAQEKALSGSQPTTTPTAGGIVTITSDAEYEALPSGTTFVGPDEKTRRKP
jgi:hypothetical protein